MRRLVRDYSTWQGLQEELILFPHGEHDDLFDGLQTMVEGSLRFTWSGKGMCASSQDAGHGRQTLRDGSWTDDLILREWDADRDW